MCSLVRGRQKAAFVSSDPETFMEVEGEWMGTAAKHHVLMEATPLPRKQKKKAKPISDEK